MTALFWGLVEWMLAMALGWCAAVEGGLSLGRTVTLAGVGFLVVHFVIRPKDNRGGRRPAGRRKS
ncbi:hypothetical protein [Actinacidiphila sp. bgisy160]|uniref:hypothetical protein n=1 Tax=Actinacidiphila sp. bgisy160 TaxID=3413796 RepID=UPI003D7115E8